MESKLDTLKLILAVGLLVGGIGVFYQFPGQPTYVRVLMMLGAMIFAVAVVYRTEPGRQLWGFIQESRNEVRKVVWPTRTETIQTTLMVVAMVIAAGILLWVLDMFLLWAVKYLTGRGS